MICNWFGKDKGWIDDLCQLFNIQTGVALIKPQEPDHRSESTIVQSGPYRPLSVEDMWWELNRGPGRFKREHLVSQDMFAYVAKHTCVCR